MHACDTVSDDSTVLCRITDDLPSDTEIVAMLNRDTDLDLDGERSSYRLARTSLAAIDQIEERPRYVLHCKAKITYDDRGSMSECSTMAQTTMAHASMASPLWRRSGLAHSGMARSSTAQFRCGAVSVRRIPVWRRSSTAHFSMAQIRCGASKHRPKCAVLRATCHLYHQNKIFQLHQLKNELTDCADSNLDIYVLFKESYAYVHVFYL